MDAFSAPSFSLGFDDDDDPPPPPSFSLGLDFTDVPTDDDEPRPVPSPIPHPNDLDDFDEDVCIGALDPAAQPAFKRLRRGPGNPATATATAEDFVNVDDEIEEFSEEEEWKRDECATLRSHVGCSSSKLSLHSRGLLTSQKAKGSKDSKVAPSNATAPPNIATSSREILFPKLTISPIRKFCLVDSDSDDPSSSRDRCKDTANANASVKTKQSNFSRTATINEEKAKFVNNSVQTESSSKDSGPKNNISLATPVLDEFCEEYFSSAKDRKMKPHKEEDMSFIHPRMLDPDDDAFQEYDRHKITGETGHTWNMPGPQPPAYQYFYHKDARIQATVRQRLCYFVPIGAEKHRGNNHSTTENLDYMGQFGTVHAPCQARGTMKSTSENVDYMSQFGTTRVSAPVNRTREKGEGSSKKRASKPKTNKAKQSSPANEGWVNPKSNFIIPKDAGKRRVSADVNQSGHWFTGQDGRRVYVTKNGQELTGRAAYSNYKKENGGFKKSNKKAAVGKPKSNKKAAVGKRKR